MEVTGLMRLLFIIAIVTGMSRSMLVTQYRDPGGNRLQNMAVDMQTGDIYIGGTNSIAKLSDDLMLKEHVLTRGNGGDVVSKGLLVDRRNGQLIVCTSQSGTCEFRSLSDISRVLNYHSYPIVPNNKSRKNLVFPLLDSEHVFVVNDFKKNEGSPPNSLHIISSRRIRNLNLTHEDGTGMSVKDILLDVPSGFFVQYIYGFSHGDFTYLIAVQPTSLQDHSDVVTKLIRICSDDKYMRSYIEIPLDCLATASMQYKQASAAFFESRKSQLYVGFSKSSDSALCVYNMKDIDIQMDTTVTNCFQGNGIIGPSHIHRQRQCVATSADPDFCGQSEVADAYSSIVGVAPVFKRPVIDFPNTVVTSVLAHVESLYTVVYLGTSSGFLKKVTLAFDGSIALVREVSLDVGKEVMSSMFFNKDHSALYAMTETKVTRVVVDHCEEKTSCQACTAMADPICGWCVLENRCTKKESCPDAAINPTWLPASKGACAAMRDIRPDILSYETLEDSSTPRQISFRLDRISLLEPSNINLHCSFVSGATMEKTMATVLNDRIICPLPPRAKLPALPQGQVKANEDHSVLEVEFQVEGRTVVKRDLSVFNCRANQNCTACTESSFGCKWCHVKGMCVDVTTPNCLDQTVAGIESPASCPRIETSAKDKDIVVHSGESKKIAVRVSNLLPDQETNIHCLFTYMEEVSVAPGTISSSNLICDPLEFYFNSTSWPIVMATFTVTSGPNSVPLDNPQDIKVRIYKCPLMVTNCGQCLSMDPEYECGWCDSECTLQTDCQSGMWLDRSATCKDPQILRFSPSTGPMEGKTNISVTGINLGKAYTDLTVTVAGVRCIVHQHDYEPSSRFTCETEATGTALEGVIEVTVDSKYTAESDSLFQFVDPRVVNLSPKQGPQSGGTTLALYGEYMNTGTMTTVDVGGSPCEVMRSNMTSLVCVTSQHVSNQRSVDVEITFGGSNGLRRLLTGDKFTYEKDPEISMIEPKKTILSGGTRITVMSNHMQLIQNPEFFVDLGDRKVATKCSLFKRTLLSWLVCKTPKLMFPGENITVTSPREVHYGFNLDGVTTFRNISEDPNFGPLLYFPDPEVEPLPSPGEGMKKYEKDHKLIIKGKFRSLSLIMTDVNVTVGGSECTNPASTDDAISCIPPKKPITIDSEGNAPVMLQIGNMEVDVGVISYYKVEEPEKTIAVGIILGVVLPIIAIIVLLTICVIRRHRNHKPSENYIPDVLKDYEGKREEEEIGMNHVSVKADMNGSIPDDKETGPYIDELLSKVEDEAVKQNIRDFLILRKMLDIGELLGKGNFGVTCKATYSKSEEENPTDVAVKTLQGTQTDNDNIAAFLQTCAKYKDLQHPGVSPIMGVCITASDDPMLVLPYAQNGDLKSYVRDSNRNLMVLELLDMAEQVAEAMAYLDSVHIVHGNLAARNCLVNSDKKVQVSEYGLTEELYSKDSYLTENGKTKNLVKWMAPEAIDNITFDVKSDVWSYGVVLWELLTRGVTPYPDVDNGELRDYLEKGSRMKKPRQCPENIYELMLRCWAQVPDVRPTFRQIADEIHTFISTEGLDEQAQGDTAPLKTSIDVGASAEFI